MALNTLHGSQIEALLCPVRYSLDIVGGKWKLPILCILSTSEPARYSAIRRKIGEITNMMLTQSLKELEAAGMIYRKQYNEIPPRVEYSLTEKGRSILPILVQLATWGLENMRSDSEKCVKCQATI